jgi:hypothetical protein
MAAEAGERPPLKLKHDCIAARADVTLIPPDCRYANRCHQRVEHGVLA